MSYFSGEGLCETETGALAFRRVTGAPSDLSVKRMENEREEDTKYRNHLDTKNGVRETRSDQVRELFTHRGTRILVRWEANN